MTPTLRTLIYRRHELSHVQSLARAYALRAEELRREVAHLENIHRQEQIDTAISEGRMTICKPSSPDKGALSSLQCQRTHRAPVRKAAKPTISSVKLLLASLTEAERSALLTSLGL